MLTFRNARHRIGARIAAFLLLSFGSLSDLAAESLSQSELNALQARLRNLWTVQVGTERPEDLIVDVHIQLRPDGRLAAPPEVVSRGTSLPYRKAADAALSAVQEAQPFDMWSAPIRWSGFSLNA